MMVPLVGYHRLGSAVLKHLPNLGYVSLEIRDHRNLKKIRTDRSIPHLNFEAKVESLSIIFNASGEFSLGGLVPRPSRGTGGASFLQNPNNYWRGDAPSQSLNYTVAFGSLPGLSGLSHRGIESI
jgi:hypothetical protein